MRNYSKITTTLLLLAVTFNTINAACNTDILEKFLKRATNNRKENADEPDFPDFNPLASVATTGYTAEGICGPIWTAAQGTCCDQKAIQARADRLVKKIQKRHEGKKRLNSDGKDKVLKALDKIEAKLAVGKPGKEARITELKAKIAKLKEGAAIDETLNAASKAKMLTCMKTLVEMRVKVWCLACANTGGSPLDTTNYFTSDNIQVKQTVCETLITECGEVFAFGRRVTKGDRALRGARSTLTGAEEPVKVETLPESSDQDITDDKACVDDLAGCKSDTTKRQGMCRRFNINNEDSKTFGDTNSLKDVNVDGIKRLLTNNAGTNFRMMQDDTQTSGPAVENAAGADLNTIDAKFTVKAEELSASRIVSLGVLIFSLVASVC